VAQPPTGGASGSSTGGFGDQSGSFGGMQSGYAADALTVYTNHFAPYVAATLSLLDKRLTVTPQFRLQVLTLAGNPGSSASFSHAYLSPEPRLALRYQLTPRVALKGAVGLYSQPPSPDLLSPVFGNPNLGPALGTQYVAGVDVDLTSTLHLETEAFWKQSRHLPVPGENPGDPPLTDDGKGRAYGAELMLRQQLSKNFLGWVSYTFSRSERQLHPDQAWRRYQFDQTHILTLMGSYTLPRGFQIGARYRYVTGNPYTPVAGAYYDSNADKYTALYGPPASVRLPAFNQLDLRIDKIFTFDKWRLSLYLDVQNVLRASNPEAIGYNYNFTVPHPVSGLPLLPIIGIRGDF
jgi:hypothetical protein